MLTDYQEITEDLNDFELKEVLPLVIKGFKTRMKKGQIGKSNSVTSATICRGVNRKLEIMIQKYTLQPVKLRKMIGVIRQMNYIPALCSCSSGYYVAETMSELDSCIQSLEERIRQQNRVLDALKKQKKVITADLKKDV